MMMKEVIHIKGIDKPRLCGAAGNYECVGDDKVLPLCEDCQKEYLLLTGEVIE